MSKLLKKMLRMVVGTIKKDKVTILEFREETPDNKAELNCMYDRVKYQMNEPRFYKQPEVDSFKSILEYDLRKENIA